MVLLSRKHRFFVNDDLFHFTLRAILEVLGIVTGPRRAIILKITDYCLFTVPKLHVVEYSQQNLLCVISDTRTQLEVLIPDYGNE